MYLRREDGVELRNDATPVLDLSNLYGTVGDTISIRGSGNHPTFAFITSIVFMKAMETLFCS